MAFLVTCLSLWWGCFAASGQNYTTAGNNLGPGPFISGFPNNAIPPGQATLYVTTNGNDATAKLGRADLPWLNFSNALTLATNGQIVQLGYGTFFYTNAVPNTGVTINGMGISSTTLLSWNEPGSASIIRGGDFPAAMYITNSGVTLSNLRLGFADSTLPAQANGGGVMPVLYFNPDASGVGLFGFAEHFYAFNVELDGNTDCIDCSYGHSSGTFVNCILHSFWDCVMEFNGPAGAMDLDFYNCNFIVTNNTVVSPTQGRGIVVDYDNSRVRVFGGMISVTNIISTTSLDVRANTGHVELYNTLLYCASNGVAGTNLYIVNGGTVKYLAQDTYDNLYGASTRYGLAPTRWGDTTNTPVALSFLSSDGANVRYWNLNGNSLTNLLLRETTNALPVFQLSDGLSYYTNMSAALTLTAFQIPASLEWEIHLWCSNNSGANRTLTGPNGSRGSYAGVSLGTPAAYVVTNGQVVAVKFRGYGFLNTNMIIDSVAF